MKLLDNIFVHAVASDLAFNEAQWLEEGRGLGQHNKLCLAGALSIIIMLCYELL